MSKSIATKYKKNDIFQVDIEDIGINGEGIGKVDGYTVFVKDAVIGDVINARIVKPEKNYAYARLESVISYSDYRVEAMCDVARSCGGCQIQETDYNRQLIFKKQKVLNNINRIGEAVDYEIYDTIGMENPTRYRNKAQFPIGYNKENRIVAGFYAGRTHSIIEVNDCKIGIEENKEILSAIIKWMNEYGITAYDENKNQGIVRHVLIRKAFITKELMVCLVINANKLPHQEELINALIKLKNMTSITYNVNTLDTNVILGSKINNLYGDGYIRDYIGEIKFRISPLSFYQVNPISTKVLYEKALEYADLTGNEVVWDLYCGVGTISLFLAQKAKKVYGVEIIPEAIEDAKVNANLNGIKNAEFFIGKSEVVYPTYIDKCKERADVVVVDPPRKGCDKVLLEALIENKPERIVYVSCDSATLARDIKILCDGGFKLEKVQPVDMFPHTAHVETVCLLSRK